MFFRQYAILYLYFFVMSEKFFDRRSQDIPHDRPPFWKQGDPLLDIPAAQAGTSGYDFSENETTVPDYHAQAILKARKEGPLQEITIPTIPLDESFHILIEESETTSGPHPNPTLVPLPPSPPALGRLRPYAKLPITPAEKAKQPSLPSAGGWRKKALVGFAGLAAFFGVKIGFQKAEGAAKDRIEDASKAFDYYSGRTESRMAEAGRAFFDQQPSEPPNTKDEQKPLTRTYTVEQADTLWGYANKLVDEVGVEDPDGTIALGALTRLREANDIQGDPARSKKMWVGATIDATSAYDFVASHKQAEHPASALVSEQTPSPRSASSVVKESTSSPDTTHAQISHKLLSHTLNHPGETVWSRTHDMLESLGVKPNMARRGVLGAIVLADSHMSEAQAMRVKYAGHKKFDAAKDTLNFTRAAQAALDLKHGMSPGDVAKKYDVKNQYEKLRDR